MALALLQSWASVSVLCWFKYPKATYCGIVSASLMKGRLVLLTIWAASMQSPSLITIITLRWWSGARHLGISRSSSTKTIGSGYNTRMKTFTSEKGRCSSFLGISRSIMWADILMAARFCTGRMGPIKEEHCSPVISCRWCPTASMLASCTATPITSR